MQFMPMIQAFCVSSIDVRALAQLRVYASGVEMSTSLFYNSTTLLFSRVVWTKCFVALL